MMQQIGPTQWFPCANCGRTWPNHNSTDTYCAAFKPVDPKTSIQVQPAGEAPVTQAQIKSLAERIEVLESKPTPTATEIQLYEKCEELKSVRAAYDAKLKVMHEAVDQAEANKGDFATAAWNAEQRCKQLELTCEAHAVQETHLRKQLHETQGEVHRLSVQTWPQVRDSANRAQQSETKALQRIVQLENVLRQLRIPYVSDLSAQGVKNQNTVIDNVLGDLDKALAKE